MYEIQAMKKAGGAPVSPLALLQFCLQHALTIAICSESSGAKIMPSGIDTVGSRNAEYVRGEILGQIAIERL